MEITKEQAKEFMKKEGFPMSTDGENHLSKLFTKFANHCINEYKQSLKEHDGYYCPKCKRHINGVEVTYEENCDFCGTKCI